MIRTALSLATIIALAYVDRFACALADRVRAHLHGDPVGTPTVRGKSGSPHHPCADVHARNVAALADEMRGAVEIRGMRWGGITEDHIAGVYVVQWADGGWPRWVNGETQHEVWTSFREAMARRDAEVSS